MSREAPKTTYPLSVNCLDSSRNPQASFAYFDGEVVEIRRVTYDVMRVRERMESAHLPPQLSERLSLGY